MTIVQTVLAYEPPISERELQALVGVREVYGIWALKFDEEMHRIIVDYDASRLKEPDIAFMIRNAGIRLLNPIRKAA